MAGNVAAPAAAVKNFLRENLDIASLPSESLAAGTALLKLHSGL
jgi:hypothetical protein